MEEITDTIKIEKLQGITIDKIIFLGKEYPAPIDFKDIIKLELWSVFKKSESC